MATSKEDLADIMLFYVEMGVKFTNDYVDVKVGVLMSAYRSRCYQVYEQLS